MLTHALVVDRPGAPFLFKEIEVNDDIRDDEILVEIKATGVCHTDLNFSEDRIPGGFFPVVFGHEGAGVVIKAGSAVTSTAPGDHVLLTYTHCGECRFCERKQTSYCDVWERDNIYTGRADKSFAYGDKSGKPIASHFFGQSCFSKYAVVAGKSAIRVDSSLPLDLLSPLGCGIMTGAGAMLNDVQPSEGSTVLVLGTGAVGLAALMAVKLAPGKPSRVIAVDIVAQRLELALKYGATDVINLKKTPDLKASIMAITGGRGFDGAIDTTARPDVIKTLLDSTAKRGVVVSVGVGDVAAEACTSIFDTVNSGRKYMGSVMGSCYPPDFIPRLIEAWRLGDFPFTDLIKTFPAKDMAQAVAGVLDGSVVKAVLVWD